MSRVPSEPAARELASTPRKHILLLIGDSAGWLRETLSSLKAFNFDLAATRDLPAAIRYLESSPHLALIAADSDMPHEQLVELVEHIKKLSLRVPVIWAADGEACVVASTAADLVVKRDDPLERVRSQIAQVLHESYYPPGIVQALREATSSAFVESFKTVVEVEQSFLKSTRLVSGEIAALLTMTGDSIEGYMVVGGSHSTMRAIRHRVLPSEKHSTADVADLVGELGNRLLGALKVQLAKHGIDFRTSPPMTLEGRDLSLHASIGGPSLLLTLSSELGPVNVELCLRTFNPAALERNVAVHTIPAGEVIFL